MQIGNIVNPQLLSKNRVTGAPVVPASGNFEEMPDKWPQQLVAQMTLLNTLVADMRVEIAALRLGMMDAGTCNDVPSRDVETLSALN